MIIDDVIDSAGTLRVAARAVLSSGASRVYAAATHGVFSGAAWANLSQAGFERIVVTDTMPLPPDPPGDIEVLSWAGLLANSIRQSSSTAR